MERWRELLNRLGLAAESSGQKGGNGVPPAEPVDPSAIALLLLTNAIRLLEQSSAPPEAMESLRAAVRDLEAHMTGRVMSCP